MAAKYLLVQDVEKLGRSGELVNAKPGYFRNFLLPQQLAVLATKDTLRLQTRLKEERLKQAELDLKDSQELAAKLQEAIFSVVVKIDHDGHMYGSVSVNDLAKLIHDTLSVTVEKRAIQLKHPIKEIGVHSIEIKLKEGVSATLTLKVMAEEAAVPQAS